MARRMAGSVGWGGGPGSPSVIFSPLQLVGEAEMLEERESDHDQDGVMVQTVPTAPLEVIESEFLLHLLVSLLADPARLDLPCQRTQRGIRRLVAQVVLVLAAAAPFPDQPHLIARQRRAVALRRPIGDPHPQGGELGAERALGPGPPGHALPGGGLQHLLGGNRRLTGDPALAWPTGPGSWPGHLDGGRVDGLGAGNPDRPGQTPLAQPPTKRRARAIAGIGDDLAEA